MQGGAAIFVSLTAVLLPEGHNADRLRDATLAHFDISLGTGLTKLAGKVFRIGHLGDTNDLTILGALAGVEMALALAEVPHRTGGVQAAMAYFTQAARGGVPDLRVGQAGGREFFSFLNEPTVQGAGRRVRCSRD